MYLKEKLQNFPIRNHIGIKQNFNGFGVTGFTCLYIMIGWRFSCTM